MVEIEEAAGHTLELQLNRKCGLEPGIAAVTVLRIPAGRDKLEKLMSFRTSGAKLRDALRGWAA